MEISLKEDDHVDCAYDVPVWIIKRLIHFKLVTQHHHHVYHVEMKKSLQCKYYWTPPDYDASSVSFCSFEFHVFRYDEHLHYYDVTSVSWLHDSWEPQDERELNKFYSI